MAPPDERVPGPDERLLGLADRAELTQLVSRFVTGLDHPDAQGCDETWYRALCAEDVALVLPNGTHHGIVGLPQFQSRSRRQFAHTHHLVTNCLVELGGDRATARANVRATHVRHGDGTVPTFVGGALYDVEAVRTADGWRLSRLTVTVRWTTGGPRRLPGVPLAAPGRRGVPPCP
ncbi:nuclear transport factor 2 family protein [Streptomyces sp. NPDC007808]|uniref:nuclear transport factor 2 family protein n=1 Tax=Streptomyces sp. NPDC007808 TaxID=3364779 RepID=UPI0036A2DDAE